MSEQADYLRRMHEANFVNRYVTGVEPAPPPPPPVDMVAAALFAVAGAILAFTVAFIYVGVNYLNVLGAEWHWVWEHR